MSKTLQEICPITMPRGKTFLKYLLGIHNLKFESQEGTDNFQN
jgi:hypothetical protein